MTFTGNWFSDLIEFDDIDCVIDIWRVQVGYDGIERIDDEIMEVRTICLICGNGTACCVC